MVGLTSTPLNGFCIVNLNHVKFAWQAEDDALPSVALRPRIGAK